MSFDDASRFVFAPSAERASATAVDVERNQIVGELPLGVVPRQVLISRTEAKLIGTDGKSSEFTVTDIAGATVSRVTLPHAAERLVLGASGWLLAAADLVGGTITLFDVRRGVALRRITGLPRLHDLMFVDQDATLFVAAEGWTSIGVIDVNTAILVRRIGPLTFGVATLARTPSGRNVLAIPDGAAPPSIIDVASSRIVGTLGQDAAADGVVPSGTGAFLFVPDNKGAQLRIYREGQAASATNLRATSGMGAVYTAWLDSVAFVAAAAQRQILVYDLDELRPDGHLDLQGTPGQGGVTSDSRTLYVPLTAPPGLTVIDCQARQVVATLALPTAPLAAVVPGGWGLCH